MKKLSILYLFLSLVTVYPLQAQEMHISEFAFGTDVQERELIGRDTVFTNAIETAYCFTKIEGAVGGQQVVHIWYYDGKPVAGITLPVQSGSWRTWSSKNIREDWTGSWKVIVEDGDGNILASKSFTIVSAEQENN